MKKRSKFNLSHMVTFSCDLGELVPINFTEVVPGDTFLASSQVMIRTQPLLAPLMAQIDARVHHFFVPYRLLWSSFDTFITGGPNNASNPAFPTISLLAGDLAVGSLGDYLGLPTGGALTTSALPFRAYARVFNEWFRDEDLTTELPISTGDGLDATTSRTLQLCAWAKDYFTSARPTEQKGPAISFPLGTRANVKGIGYLDNASNLAIGANVRQSDGTIMTGNAAGNNAANPLYFKLTGAGSPGAANPLDIYADLSAATGVQISALRQAFALQNIAEARMRYGSRITEYYQSAFGVHPEDARMDIPEYLGGGSDLIQFSEVLQTAADGANPVGTLRGHGLGYQRGNAYMRGFKEFGCVLSLLSVRPRALYSQGVRRGWNRRTRNDFYQPELEGIGQQAVLNKEIYAAGASPDGTFGFQDRYDEYRSEPSRVAGEMRTLLKQWHIAREFAAAPALNDAFVKCVPNEANVFPVPAQDVLYVHVRNNIRARRVMRKVAKQNIL